jgi:hypothetical protein
MWQLVKAELKYNKQYLFFISLFILIYAAFAITDFRLVSKTLLEKGSWGILFMAILFFSFYIIWLNRMREKRTRMFSLLPIQIHKIALSRFIFIQTMVICILLSMVLTILMSNSSWLNDTDDILFQIGSVLIIFSIIVGVIDVWFIFRDNLFVKLLGTVVFLTAVGIPTVMVFIYLRPIFYHLMGVVPGKILYILWGSVLLWISASTFVKRICFLI